jgi:hypothetical protein
MKEHAKLNGADEKKQNLERSIDGKKKRKNHSQLGPGFVAPDGGFGWLICMAAGTSNVRNLFNYFNGN